MAVTWSYNGSTTLVATVDDAVIGDHYRLRCEDDSSSSVDVTAAGTTLLLTVSDISNTPLRSFAAEIFHDPASAGTSADVAYANVFDEGTASTTGTAYAATWAYDGVDTTSVTITAAAGATYYMWGRPTAGAEYSSSFGPFTGGSTQTLTWTHSAPTTGKRFQIILADNTTFGDYSDRLFQEGVANAGDPGNPTSGGGGGPTISSISPSSGCSGDQIVLTGTGFTGATDVDFFSGQAAVFTVDSDTQITATVPNGATTGSILVTTPAGIGASAMFTVNPEPVNDNYPTTSSLYYNEFVPPGSGSRHFYLGHRAGGCVDGTAACATAQAGEPNPFPATPAAHSVWFTLDAWDTGTWRFTISSSDPDMADGVMSIYDWVPGAVSGLGAALAQGDNNIGTEPSFDVALVGGNSYAIQVDTRDAGGAFTLTWFEVTASPPANDAFASATVEATDTWSASGTTCDATAECGEPRTPWEPGSTVWYKWVAPRSGATKLTLTGPNYSKVAVYAGTTLAGLTYTGASIPFSAVGGASTFFSAAGGTTYYFRVQGFCKTFTLDLLMTCAAAPANDDFANATDWGAVPAVGRINGSVDEDICGATLEAGEQNPAAGYVATGPVPALGSVWWKFTIPGPGMFSLQLLANLPGYVSPVDNPGRLELWRGTALGALTLMNTWTAYPVVAKDETVCIPAGNYYVRVGSWDWDTNVKFRWQAQTTSIQIKVGEINVGDTVINTGFGRKASAVILFGNACAADVDYQADGRWGIGCSDSNLNQWAGGMARNYQTMVLNQLGAYASDVTAGRVFKLVDGAGAVTQEASATAFNADGTINLAWTASSEAGKIAYWAIVDVDVHVETQTFIGTTNLAAISTPWKIKSILEAADYALAVGGAGYMNSGFSWYFAGAIGERVGFPGGTVASGILANWLDGGEYGEFVNYESFTAVLGANDSITSWTHGGSGIGAHDPVTLGILIFGGLGWQVVGDGPGPELPGTPVSWPVPGAFKIAGALGGAAHQFDWTVIGPPRPLGVNPVICVTACGYDVHSNQFVMLYGDRAFNQYPGEGPFIDAISIAWRGYYSDRLAYSLAYGDDGSVLTPTRDWSIVETVTPATRGRTTTGAFNPNPGAPNMLTFGAVCLIPTTTRTFRPQIVRYR